LCFGAFNLIKVSLKDFKVPKNLFQVNTTKDFSVHKEARFDQSAPKRFWCIFQSALKPFRGMSKGGTFQSAPKYIYGHSILHQGHFEVPHIYYYVVVSDAVSELGIVFA
jgi:hypothetical protein